MSRRRKPIRLSSSDAPIRAVAYLRLSKAKASPDKDNAGKDLGKATEVGLETQLDGCKRHITALGGTVVAIEQDIQSGDRLDRPGLWGAIERIQEGSANALIVYAIDRFGRDSVQQGVAVHAIRSAGGRLLSATENLEEGPLGDFMRSAMTFAAAVELGKVRERTSRAFDAKFKQTARYKPSVRPPYGYRKVGAKEATTYEIEPSEAAVVRRIFTERAAGASLRRILTGLSRDGIPTPTGRGRWGESTINRILHREAYATGQHECWRTLVVRDASGVPSVAERPPDERYFATFPAFLDPALVARARATSERNVWYARRNDRPAEFGLLRYGFARCAGCGRALAVNNRGNDRYGRPRYDCRSFYGRVCPAPASISVDRLDGPILTWLQSLIEDPSRADTYRVERCPMAPDPEALTAAMAAERLVAELERDISGRLAALALLTGAVQVQAAQELDACNEELEVARAERDRLAAACRVTTSGDALTIAPQDALGRAFLDAIRAMIDADPDPTATFSVMVPVPDGIAEHYDVPLSWKAWQAALAVLNLTVAVAQEKSDQPRWSAEMRLPGGVAVRGPAPSYLFSSCP